MCRLFCNYNPRKVSRGSKLHTHPVNSTPDPRNTHPQKPPTPRNNPPAPPASAQRCGGTPALRSAHAPLLLPRYPTRRRMWAGSSGDLRCPLLGHMSVSPGSSSLALVAPRSAFRRPLGRMRPPYCRRLKKRGGGDSGAARPR